MVINLLVLLSAIAISSPRIQSIIRVSPCQHHSMIQLYEKKQTEIDNFLVEFAITMCPIGHRHIIGKARQRQKEKQIKRDMVCCLLSEWCVATSFCQSSAYHVFFCETYGTLSSLFSSFGLFFKKAFYRRRGFLAFLIQSHAAALPIPATAAKIIRIQIQLWPPATSSGGAITAVNRSLD